MIDENQIRINELARELEVKAKLVILKLFARGWRSPKKKTHSSSIDVAAAAAKVRKHFQDLAADEAAAAAKADADKVAKDAAAKAARLRPVAVPPPAAPVAASL